MVHCMKNFFSFLQERFRSGSVLVEESDFHGVTSVKVGGKDQKGHCVSGHVSWVTMLIQLRLVIAL